MTGTAVKTCPMRQISMHAKPARGLSSTGHSPSFDGRFGRIFRTLPPAQFGKSDTENDDNLSRLAAAMVADFEPARDGADDEESGIPALYTYLGQFIDHDLTFDPNSSLQKQNDPEALTDFRTPALDLDCIYGRGPDDQPYMYDADGIKFLRGTSQLNGGTALSDGGLAFDLPRAANGRAIIGDPRNDENTIVSQFQGLMLRFHNRMVDTMPGAAFSDVQRIVRYHYQYVVLNDFLSKIVHTTVLDDLKTNGTYDQDKLKFFTWRNEPFMPVEFAVACYRFGHSMVRPGYRLNDDDSTLDTIFPLLAGFQPVDARRGIEWGRFIDIEKRTSLEAGVKRRLQLAYRIDTSIVNPLGNLPPDIAPMVPSLAKRNLARSWRLGLPSGQNVARKMGIEPLRDEEILIGKATGSTGDIRGSITQVGGEIFAGNCPLWTYILAEAMHYQEKVDVPVLEAGTTTRMPKLGPVGGRIVAEVFLGLLFGDSNSYLNHDPYWTPKDKNFKLKDLIQLAL